MSLHNVEAHKMPRKIPAGRRTWKTSFHTSTTKRILKPSERWATRGSRQLVSCVHVMELSIAPHPEDGKMPLMCLRRTDLTEDGQDLQWLPELLCGKQWHWGCRPRGGRRWRELRLASWKAPQGTSKQTGKQGQGSAPLLVTPCTSSALPPPDLSRSWISAFTCPSGVQNLAKLTSKAVNRCLFKRKKISGNGRWNMWKRKKGKRSYIKAGQNTSYAAGTQPRRSISTFLP